jgi:hypothetical protein
MKKLIKKLESSKIQIAQIIGGTADQERPKLISRDVWTDGLNTYEDTYWSDGSQACGQFISCDC